MYLDNGASSEKNGENREIICEIRASPAKKERGGGTVGRKEEGLLFFSFSLLPAYTD